MTSRSSHRDNMKRWVTEAGIALLILAIVFVVGFVAGAGIALAFELVS